MERKQFKIQINAPKEKVWKTLWEADSYAKWTSAFCEGSRAVTDWKEGSKVLFVDGMGEGMTSIIEANKPNEFMSFKHLGMVKDGTEDTSSDKVKAWSGALENYALKEAGGVTELIVDMDLAEEYKDYFTKTFPAALEEVKKLAEIN